MEKPTGPPTRVLTPTGGDSPDGPASSLRPIAGLVALGIGLVVLGAVAGGALVSGTTTAASIASSAFAVIGSIVGAYFGVKIGTDGTARAIEGQREEAAKAQVFAAHLPNDRATEVVEQAMSAQSMTGQSTRSASPPLGTRAPAGRSR